MAQDFSQVRIHADSEAASFNQQINARAFTLGSDIYFNQNEYNTGSFEGKKLLAHELTHVSQQRKLNSGNNNSLPIQRKKTAGGFFQNIWSFFAGDKDYSDETLKNYLEVLKGGQIEDDFDSDNKARVIVKQLERRHQ